MTAHDIEIRAIALLEIALDRPANSRRDWIEAQTDDKRVVDRALRLLAAMDPGDRRLSTGAFVDLEPVRLPDRIGGYRIIGLLGQGGMGSVFEAERATGDFEHRVAIKVIRPGILSAGVVERFERERQILARLAHPGIARLYDGGTTQDGSPYIVMELIDGVPVTHWVAEQDLNIAERVRLMLRICEAVSFAHQNLIVHRDITPSNILVTRDGAPKLFDFGIARPLDEDETPEPKDTQTRLSLTPGFAAPERYSGAVPTTLTDLYSLGKLLDVLTSTANDDIDLRAIAAKAAAPEPEARYASASDLARDLERYLGGYPVDARGQGHLGILSKFVARNKIAVFAGATSIVLLIGALVTAIQAYAIADRERIRAQQGLADTRTIARSMMFDIYDEVNGVPGSLSARLLLADTAQRYLESLANDRNADADARYDAAKGYFRLAQVVGLRRGGGTKGETARAKTYYVRSRDLLEKLHEQHPQRADIRSSLGQVVSVMADSALFTDGNFEKARKDAQLARKLLARLDPSDKAGAGSLVETYLHEGNALAFEGEPEPAGRLYQSGLRRIADFPEDTRNSLEVRRAEAELHRMLGAYHAYFKRPKESRSALERSLAGWRLVVRESEDVTRDIFGLAIILQSVARMELAAGDTERARGLAEEAVALARRGMAASPDDAGSRELLSSAAILKGLVLAQQGEFAEAIALADEGILHKRRLVEVSGDVVSGPMTLAVRLQEASRVYLQAGQQARACPIMREAVGIMRDYERSAELPIANRTNNLDPMVEALHGC